MERVSIDRDLCLRDGICISECPTRVLFRQAEDGSPAAGPEFEEYCIRCGHCVAVCPTGALRLDWLDPEGCRNLDPSLDLTPGQAEQFLRGRRSIRTFKEKTVPRDTLQKLLAVACSAPSARNRQPWHWTVVQNPREVRRLAGLVVEGMRGLLDSSPETGKILGYHRVVSAWDLGIDRVCREAPHLIVVHAERDWPFAPEDSALALSLLDLYAASLGLGVCWGGYLYKMANAFPPLFEALGLPRGHVASGAVMVGYPQFRYRRIPVRQAPRVTWR